MNTVNYTRRLVETTHGRRHDFVECDLPEPLLVQNKKERPQEHQRAMPNVPKHDAEQKLNQAVLVTVNF